VVNVDVSDIDAVGKVATIGNVFLGSFGFAILVFSILPGFKAASIRTLKLQALVLILPTLVIFGGMIPFTIFFKNRSAQVTAFIGTTQLPASLVQSVQARSGAESKYSKIWYLRLLAIFPWISFAFAVVAIAVIFLSSSRASPDATESTHMDSISSDKASTSHHEKTTV